MRLKKSLLAKYLLLISLALVLLPITVIAGTIVMFNLPQEPAGGQANAKDYEEMWHREASQLAGAAPEQIDERLYVLKEQYPDLTMFWVDDTGKLRLQLPVDPSLPAEWSVSDTVQFMKKYYDAPIYTVVALIGQETNHGFIAMQIPRNKLGTSNNAIQAYYQFIMLAGILLVMGAFFVFSWLFFYKIRKRLLRLQQSMTTPARDGLPERIQVELPDEIGRLEQAFNDMIDQLEQSRHLQQEEEGLRRKLIANLSHDLRTPLTAIRGHAYQLKQEALSEPGQQSLELIDRKIAYLAQLIENLLSYTLLSAGKYPYRSQRIDATRTIRTLIANWYPAFEREQFTIKVELPDEAIMVELDPQWLERVVDNLFQNVLRHAQDGRYLQVRFSSNPNRKAILTIKDHGPGMQVQSKGEGAGIGLSIVDLMIKEMKLDWKIQTSPKGSTITVIFMELPRN